MSAAEPSALNELLKAWRSHPDEDTTTALCGYLGATLQLGLIGEVGRTAESAYSQNPEVLLAVGRMYLAAGMFPAAWRALAYARRADQRDPRPFRYLAEVLLRQGEATRASELLQRALEHGVTSNDILTLNEQLVEYMELERTEGAGAVAVRVAGDATQMHLRPDGSPVSSRARPAADDDDDTQVLDSRDSEKLRSELRESRAEFVSVVDLLEDDDLEEASLQSVSELGAGRAELLSADLIEEPEPPRPEPPLKSSPVYSPAMRPAQKSPEPRVEDSVIVAPSSLERGRPRSVPPPTPTLPPAAKLVSTSPPAPERAFAAPASAPPPPALVPPKPSLPPGAVRPSPRPPLKPTPSAPVPAIENRAWVPTLPPAAVSPLSPPRVPQDVGVVGFKDETTAQRTLKTRRKWLLTAVEVALGLCVLGAAGFVAVRYADEQQTWARKSELGTVIQELSALNRRVEPAVQRTLSARIQSLGADAVASPALARLRIRHCVVSELVFGQACNGLAQALQRAEVLGLPKRARISGELLMLLEKGNIAAAVGLVRHWEDTLSRDPYFQLGAGMALELAADPHARKFYARARELDKGLQIAALLDSRLTLLDRSLGLERAFAKDWLEPLAGTLESRVVGALAVPSNHTELKGSGGSPISADTLAAPARPLLSLVQARAALLARKFVEAGNILAHALERAESPAVRGALGMLAVDAGRLDLANQVANVLEAIDADEPNARVLRARGALLEGKLGEAERLVARLAADPLGQKLSFDLAILRSTIAYEEASAEGLRDALSRAGTDAAMSEPLKGAAVGLQLFSGGALSSEELRALVSSGAYWAGLVAIDAALDAGDLERAEELLLHWPAIQDRPLHLLRLARLRRYEGRIREGVDITTRLFGRSVRTRRLLTEHAFLLLATGQDAQVKELYSTIPEAKDPWLSALLGFGPRAVTLRIRSMELPADETLDGRVVVARTLALARDPRTRSYVAAIQRDFPNNPVVRRLEAR
ncbi:MAG: hypothetical protein SFV15_16100 [Polyangiaceae bacterium]|nr:hypothetical protein [Polyangiaceae bacterium]